MILDRKQQFDEYIQKPEVIDSMINSINFGSSPLSGVVKDLEFNFPDMLKYVSFRIWVGKRISEVLKPFGFTSIGGKQITVKGSKYFKTSSKYKLRKELVRLKIVKKVSIEEI